MASDGISTTIIIITHWAFKFLPYFRKNYFRYKEAQDFPFIILLISTLCLALVYLNKPKQKIVIVYQKVMLLQGKSSCVKQVSYNPWIYQ